MSLALCGKVLALQANNKHTTIEVGSVGEWNLNYNGKVKILMEVEGPIEKRQREDAVCSSERRTETVMVSSSSNVKRV